MKFEPVVDLEESSGHDFGYSLFHPYIIHPVETNDAIAVFFINEDTYIKGQIQSDYGDCHLMVFDKQWNFKYYSKLPLAGVVKDMGDIRYSPEADKIFYAYSTYLTGQYASSRVVVQSISIDDVTGADAGRPTVPTTFYVRQNSPNPFNASTRIDFDLPAKSQMSITVFNLLGQKVKTVLSGSLESGRHSVYWDGTDHDGTTVASGVYIYQVRTEHDSATRKMILLK
jgi:hypothetical protein